MSRTIVLTIPNNEEAERWAQSMLDADTNGTVMLPASARIDAMIARPTLYCKCVSRKKEGWSRTTKFGWWVHPRCRRPARLVVERFISNMLGGCNDLLPTLSGSEPGRPYWIKEQ
jgi:hypothetical protein